MEYIFFNNRGIPYLDGLQAETRIVKLLMLVILSLSLGSNAIAQKRQPIKWQFSVAPADDKNETSLIFTATLEEGWHVYSQFMEEGGPLPTAFDFEENADYSLIGKVKENGTAVKNFDKTFMIDITWYAETVMFIQKVKLNKPGTIIKGKIEFMLCRNDLCLPPDEVEFSMDVKSPDIPGEKNNGD